MDTTVVPNRSQFHLSERQVEGKLRGILITTGPHDQVFEVLQFLHDIRHGQWLRHYTTHDNHKMKNYTINYTLIGSCRSKMDEIGNLLTTQGNQVPTKHWKGRGWQKWLRC